MACECLHTSRSLDLTPPDAMYSIVNPSISGFITAYLAVKCWLVRKYMQDLIEVLSVLEKYFLENHFTYHDTKVD
jgi:hypothetical protein